MKLNTEDLFMLIVINIQKRSFEVILCNSTI